MALQLENTVSPFDEMAAYETVWNWKRGSLKDVTELFSQHSVVPSRLLSILQAERLLDEIAAALAEVRAYLENLRGFSVCLHGDFVYPTQMRDARYPLELFYYRGDIDLATTRCVSVVGARKCSEEGARRASRLARGLVEQGYTVVSGLAEGIDTAAMTAAIEANGRTVGVIGTPINETYPKKNRDLQEQVAQDHLLLSQVPFFYYKREPFNFKKRYFPERNETMSALSEATIIVEASDTSGSLTQARACLQQGRKLFILNSCFDNRDISWPETYEQRGAIRVRNFDDVFAVLGDRADADNDDDAMEKI